MMNPQLYKILIACSDNCFIEQIKIMLSQINLTGIYLIATDKASFYTKLEWMQPDLILSDTASGEFSGLDAKTFTKIYLSEAPFIFFADISETMNHIDELALHSADGVIYKKHMDEAPQLIRKILTRYHHIHIKKREEQSKTYSSRIKFHKALALLKDLNSLTNKEQVNDLIGLMNPN